MPSLRSRQCLGCDAQYDVLTHADGTSWPCDNESDDLVDDCPKCGSTRFIAIVGVPIGVNLGGPAGVGKVYPYFDRNLGMTIESHAHRKKVCDEMGLIPTDGETVTDSAEAKERRRKFEESANEGKKYLERVENDSDFAFMRRNREKEYQLANGSWVKWYDGRAVRERNARGEA